MPDQIFMTLKTYFKSQVLYEVTSLGTWGLMYAVQQVSQRLSRNIKSFEYCTKQFKSTGSFMIKMNRPLGTTGEALFYFIELKKSFKGKRLGLYYKVYRLFRFSHNLKTWGLKEYR